METTLSRIQACGTTVVKWHRLLEGLGKKEADHEPLPIFDVYKILGLHDAISWTKTVQGCDKEIRLLAVSYARQVQHLAQDERCLKAIDIAERLAHGLATEALRSATALHAMKAFLDSGDMPDYTYSARGAAWESLNLRISSGLLESVASYASRSLELYAIFSNGDGEKGFREAESYQAKKLVETCLTWKMNQIDLSEGVKS